MTDRKIEESGTGIEESGSGKLTPSDFQLLTYTFLELALMIRASTLQGNIWYVVHVGTAALAAIHPASYLHLSVLRVVAY